MGGQAAICDFPFSVHSQDCLLCKDFIPGEKEAPLTAGQIRANGTATNCQGEQKKGVWMGQFNFFLRDEAGPANISSANYPTIKDIGALLSSLAGGCSKLYEGG